MLRVVPLTGEGDVLKSELHHLLSFRSRRDLDLPPLRNEDVPTLGYAIRFDGVAQIRMEDLLLATRLCSLSLIGSRIFGSFARVLIPIVEGLLTGLALAFDLGGSPNWGSPNCPLMGF